MRQFIIAILVPLLIPMFSFNDGADTIEWKEGIILKWSDFIATPLDNSRFAAVSNTGVSIKSYKITPDKGFLEIVAFFDRTGSWTKSKSSTLLGHEQGHFNIAEIFARRLRKKMLGCKIKYSKAHDIIKALHQQMLKEEEAFHDLYDKETNFSKNFEKQKEWENRIAHELQSLSEFSASKITVRVK